MYSADRNNKEESGLHYDRVNRAFSKQATGYDQDDQSNPVLQQWRHRVYNHIEKYLKPNSNILEINAGTGIDAVYFASQGHRVHATDLSDGMIQQIKNKKQDHELRGDLTFQQCSFEELNKVVVTNVDCIFSNFGGLNCAKDLSRVFRHFDQLLNPNGLVTLVIMPKICPWEWLWVLNGKPGKAFRRFAKNGAHAYLEGQYFQTYYHSFSDIQKALGPSYYLLENEALGLLSPPPGSKGFFTKFPRLTQALIDLERKVGSFPPFNRWGDHIVGTFRYQPSN